MGLADMVVKVIIDPDCIPMIQPSLFEQAWIPGSPLLSHCDKADNVIVNILAFTNISIYHVHYCSKPDAVTRLLWSMTTQKVS